MVNIEEFGISNFRLAVKVMTSGKCQCKPNEVCPCKEWIEDTKCACSVFWDNTQTEFTANEKKILKSIRESILKQCKTAGVE